MSRRNPLAIAVSGLVLGGTTAVLLGIADRPQAPCRCIQRRAGEQPPAAGAPRLPFAFLENRGQWDTPARFVARLPGVVARCEDAGLVLDLTAPDDASRGVVVRLELEHALPTVELVGEEPLPGRHSFLYGSTSDAWHTGVRGYRRVVYRGVRPGVDLHLRQGRVGLEYDLHVAPRTALSRVTFRCLGTDGLRIDDDGALVLGTAHGALRQPAPKTWFVLPSGARQPVGCRFVALGRDRYGFELEDAAADLPLVIDPGLLWASFLGGSMDENYVTVDVDPTGDVAVAGSTLSLDFPTTPGAYGRVYAGAYAQPRPIGDVFVARFAQADGALLFATYVGGQENDVAAAVRATPSGDVVVAGWTTSADYPTTAGAFDRTFNGVGQGYQYLGGDLFVTRVHASGTSLVYSTFVGGNDLEYVKSMAVDRTGAVTLSGHVHSKDFPTTPGAYSRQIIGSSDCFVLRLDPTASSLLFSTFFGGGTGEEYGLALAVDPATGATVFGGPTDSSDLPVTPNAFDPTFNGGLQHYADGFVARIDATGANLELCSYIGTPQDDYVLGVAIDAGGIITLCGETNSTVFPTSPQAFDRTANGKLDAFVLRLDAAGSNMLYSTYLGGDDDDSGTTAIADGSGAIVVAGTTMSGNFPVTAGAFDTSYNGNRDVFVARLDPTGSQLRYASFYGGSSSESCGRVAVGPGGSVYVAGNTWSSNLPTTAGAWDPTHNGGADAFVAKLSLLPTGVTRFGSATAGCSGSPFVGASSLPQIGNAAFELTCARAPGGGLGALLLGADRLAAPLQVFGAAIWIDPQKPLLTLATGASQLGGTAVGVPIPNDPRLVGGIVHGQLVWLDSCASGGLSASNAAQVVLQP